MSNGQSGTTNPAYGYWSEEETNWSQKDTEIVNNVLKQDNEPVKISYEEIKRRHEARLLNEHYN